ERQPEEELALSPGRVRGVGDRLLARPIEALAERLDGLVRPAALLDRRVPLDGPEDPGEARILRRLLLGIGEQLPEASVLARALRGRERHREALEARELRDPGFLEFGTERHRLSELLDRAAKAFLDLGPHHAAGVALGRSVPGVPPEAEAS